VKIQNTRSLIDPDKFRLKVLIYGLPGVGKTEWASTAPNPGIIACETGHGSGLMTVASKGLDYVEPQSLRDFQEILDGKVFADKDTIVLDSLTAISSTFIKEAALKIPRVKGDSAKRKEGVPELDDYGTMAEITRALLRDIIGTGKHIVVTATEKFKAPDPETGIGELQIGPELPGQMFTGSAAMFDVVLRLRTRQALRIPGDAKSRYVERYLVTQPDGKGTIAKCRNSMNGKHLLDKEEPFDLDKGLGTFGFMLTKILKGYEIIR
jgi:hypothetical protein